MTIKEAKAMRVIVDAINPITATLLPEHQMNAIRFLKKQIEKKAKQYPKHFKH